MLNDIWARPLAQAGELAGAAGGSLLSGVGKILEPLDWARQAAWNAPRRLMEGDIAGAAPGLLGLGAGLAAAPLGLPAAALIGSAVGGLSQGIGLQADPERFKAPTPQGVASQLTGLDEDSWGAWGLGMGLGVAGDPLGFGLTSLGGRAGAQAGRAGGRFLENAAWARGPGYQGGEDAIRAMGSVGEDLRGFARRPDHAALSARAQALLESPHLKGVAGEIPPGSTLLGAGEEAVVWKTPQGGVVRVSGGPGSYDVRRRELLDQDHFWYGKGEDELRPFPTVDSPEVLQPAREVYHGPYQVQHSPFAEVVGDMGDGTFNRGLARDINDAPFVLQDSLEASGRHLALDPHANNIGRIGDRWMYVDPGSAGLKGEVAAAGLVQPPYQPGRMTNYLLDALGSDEAVRAEIARRMTRQQGIPLRPAGQTVPLR